MKQPPRPSTPFSPESVVAEFCDRLRRYRVSAIRGYGAAWVREQFQKRGCDYWPSEKGKSDLCCRTSAELAFSPRNKQPRRGVAAYRSPF
jgi:hypothetical protein